MSKIVIVDDEESIRSLCAEELAEEGYKVITTGMCQEVPELIASAQPSAMVVDIRIDDCDGLELLKDIKEIYPDLPVILYTAYDSYREDDKSVAAEHYVVKSFNLDELKEKLAQVIRQVKEDEISWPKPRRNEES
jgi:DNA-binding NtrC family response regulator